MKSICLKMQCIMLLHLFLVASLSAQTPDPSMANMTWEELVEHWESLAVKDQNNAAIPYARAALEKALSDSSAASLDYGNSLDFLGYSLHHTGQYPEAEKCFLAAVAHASQYLGKNHEDYITRLSNLAMLHMDMDRLAEAASELESAVHLAEQNLEPDNPYLGIMVNNLGLAYERIGNMERALDFYLQALQLTEVSAGKQSFRYAIRLSNIAAIFRGTGKNQKALDFNQQALAIFEKTVGKDHPDYIGGLNGLMLSYTALARYQEALAISDTLLTWVDKTIATEKPATYDYLSGIANLYYQSGQYQRCADLSKTVLSKYRVLFPWQYSRHAYLAKLIVNSLEKTGQLEEAAVFVTLLHHFSLDELREHFSQFSEAEQAQFYQTYHKAIDNASLFFTVRHPAFPELAATAYEYQMTVKGFSLSNRRELYQSLRNDSNMHLEGQFGTWQHIQAEISKQYALAPARRHLDLDSLLALSNELERGLAIASEPFRLTSLGIHWQDIQANLSAEEAAMELGRIKVPDSDSVLYAAWILRAGNAPPQQVYLFEEKELGNLASTRALYDPSSTGTTKNLRTLLWQPLEPFLKDISTLYYAPAGLLYLVNLGAVPVSDEEVVASRIDLHRLVSTQQILSLKKNKNHFIPTSALVFGGIRYESDSLALLSTNSAWITESTTFPESWNRGNALGDEWRFLSGSQVEAREVQNHLEKNGTAVIFADGFNASEGFFKKTAQHLEGTSILHLATHGFFVTTIDTNARSGFAAAENPMARAGLVLAGANRVWSGGEPLSGQEDGILTALEISRLDLSGTELAVLSACGTGQGVIAASEGILGLQSAFKMAGVHYVIMSIWNVQDQQARQFMDFFYEEWLSRQKSVPDAFRTAELKMRSLYAKPFQPMAWAGFILLQ